MSGKRAKQQRKVAHRERVHDVTALALFCAEGSAVEMSKEDIVALANRFYLMSDEQLALIAQRELARQSPLRSMTPGKGRV